MRALRENRAQGGPHAGKRFKKEERIHAWISNFTAEHLEEIARLEKKERSFLF